MAITARTNALKNLCSGVNPNDATATAEDILSGKTAYTGAGKIEGNIASTEAYTYTPSTETQTISSGYYLAGDQTILGDTNLVPENIASGVSIFGVEGSLEGGTDTSDATATAAHIIEGETAYVNGSKIEGTLSPLSYFGGWGSTLSSDGQTFTINLPNDGNGNRTWKSLYRIDVWCKGWLIPGVIHSFELSSYNPIVSGGSGVVGGNLLETTSSSSNPINLMETSSVTLNYTVSDTSVVFTVGTSDNYGSSNPIKFQNSGYHYSIVGYWEPSAYSS